MPLTSSQPQLAHRPGANTLGRAAPDFLFLLAMPFLAGAMFDLMWLKKSEMRGEAPEIDATKGQR